MRKLTIGVIDLVTKAPMRTLWARTMHANLAGIMPQVIATWCEQEGHEVTLFCFTGLEDLTKEAPKDIDIAFISAFTQAAQQAYALSNKYRIEGAVTVLGGPHARCYPQDSQKYFDYVLGFTDKQLIHDVLQDCSQYRPVGQYLSVKQQPTSLPGVRERWKFIEQTITKSPLVKVVPMIGSMGCPYTCSFCIDSIVPYQPLEFNIIKDDLRFLLKKFKRPWVGWHDPNFGVRFDDYMEAIEEAVPPNSINFIAESSLSLLSEPHLKRLKHNGFKAILPGIESWYDMGSKSKTGRRQGIEKLIQVSEHVNMILRYVPYVQTNFVLGLDCDEGPEPFELTKKFVDMTPATFPAYPLLTAFGQAAPINLQYQREGRVLPFPFHFLNNNHAMNVKPKNYSWTEFYDHVIDLVAHSFSWGSIFNRFQASTSGISRWLNLIRAISSEGFGRLKFYSKVCRLLDEDRTFRDYFEGETTTLPQFYINIIKKDLGALWEWLPEEAMYHDPNAYLKAELEKKNEHR
ncbi:MAG TPA: radical SAM protein [Thermodesulfobacteriota bacterium]|nr:radical SAM protein [Thermodesulfobacteriota bacterium]